MPLQLVTALLKGVIDLDPFLPLHSPSESLAQPLHLEPAEAFLRAPSLLHTATEDLLPFTEQLQEVQR